MAQVDGELRIGASVDTGGVKQNITNLAKSIKSAFSSMTSDAKNSSAAIQGVANQIDRTTSRLKALEDEKKKIGSTPIYSDEYLKLQKDLDKTTKSITNTNAKLTEAKNKLTELGNKQVPTEAFNKYTTKINEAEKLVDKLTEKQNKYVEVQQLLGRTVESIQLDAPYKKMQAQIDVSTNKIKEFQNIQNSLIQSGSATIANKDAGKNASSEYVKLSNQVKQYENNIISATKRQADLLNQMSDPSFRQSNVTAGVNTKEYDEVNTKIEQQKAKLAQLNTRYGEVNKSSSKLGTTIKKAFNNVHKTFDNIKNKVGNIASGFNKLRNSANKTFDDISNKGIKNVKLLIKAAIGVKTLYMLLRKIRGAIVDAFGNMSKLVPEFSDQVNELKSNLLQAKNSLATAFQPIVSVVIPILNQLCSILVTASNAVANFFATLTGQKSIYKAGKANTQVAKSIGGVGKAAKEAKKELAQYDKLLVISHDDDNNGSGGGGASDTAGLGSFEKVPTKTSNLAELIKKSWKKKDFTEVGQLLGSRLKLALDSIPWGPIQEAAKGIGSSIATLINGAVSVPGLGTTIGQTIAEYFNTAWIFLNEFVHQLDWGALGRIIGNGIVGFLLTLDWFTIADTISTGINGIATAILGALGVLETNLPTIISNISSALDMLIDDFPAEELGEIASTLINMGVDILTMAVPKLSKVGTKLGKFVNTMIKKIKWDKMGTLISKSLKAVLDACINFVKEINPDDVAKAINDLFTNIKLSKIVSGAMTLAKNIVSKLADVLGKVNWAEVGSEIGRCLSEIASKIPDLAGKLLKLAGAILKGLATALANAWVSSPVATTLVGLFTALSFSGDLSKFAGGILSKIKGCFEAEGAFSGIATALSNAFSVTGPLAAVALAGVATWGLVKLIFPIDEYEEIEPRLSTLEQSQIDKVNALSDSYDKLTEARSQEVSGIESEYSYYEDLWNELSLLVDENGKIKDGYEGRVEFITSTLAEALGIEIEITDGVIQKYKELEESIDSLITKKQAEALLDSGQDEYVEAQKKRQEALEEYVKTYQDAEAKRNEAQKLGVESSRLNQLEELDDLDSFKSEYKDQLDELAVQYLSYYDNVEDVRNAELDEAEVRYILQQLNEDTTKSYKEVTLAANKLNSAQAKAKKTLDGYNDTIEKHDTLSEAILSGDTEQIKNAVAEMTNSYTTAETALKKYGDDARDVLKGQLDAAKENYNTLKEMYDKGLIDENTVNLAKSQVDKLQEEYDKLDPTKSLQTDASHYTKIYDTQAQQAMEGTKKTQAELDKLDPTKPYKDSADHMTKIYDTTAQQAMEGTAKVQTEIDKLDPSKPYKDSAEHMTKIYDTTAQKSVETNKQIKTNNDTTSKNIKKTSNTTTKSVKQNWKTVGTSSNKYIRAMHADFGLSMKKIQLDGKNATIGNNGIRSFFGTAKTRILELFSKSNFTNKITTEFDNTKTSAKNNTTEKGGIYSLFNKAKDDTLLAFNTTNFTDKMKNKFSTTATHAKTYSTEKNTGLKSYFETARDNVLKAFNGENFTDKMKTNFSTTADKAKTYTVGDNDDSNNTDSNITGFFNKAKANILLSFNNENFNKKIATQFSDTSDDAKKYAVGENDNSNNTDNNNITGLFNKAKINLINAMTGFKDSVVNENGTEGIFAKLTENSKNPIMNLADYYGRASVNIYNNLVDAANKALQDTSNAQSSGGFFDKVMRSVSSIMKTFSYTPLALAKGGVIPPNKEFLAVLGDQKQGVNIETPLATMIEAFNTALAQNGGGSNNQPIMLTLDGKVIAQAVWDQNLKRYKQTGNYGFI